MGCTFRLLRAAFFLFFFFPCRYRLIGDDRARFSLNFFFFFFPFFFPIFFLGMEGRFKGRDKDFSSCGRHWQRNR